MINLLLIILSILVFLPVIIYFCIKAGTIGYYSAKRLAKKDNSNDKEKE